MAMTRSCVLSTYAFLALMSVIAVTDATAIKEVHNTTPSNRDTVSLNLVRDLVLGTDDSDNTNEIFGEVYDIAVDSRYRMLVVDHGFGRVQIYDSTGAFVQTVGRVGDGPGEYRSPSAIAVDAKDNIYIAGQSRVSVFDPSGQYVREIKHGMSSFTRRLRVSDNAMFVACFDVFNQTILHKYDLQSGERVLSFCDSYAVGKKVDTRVEMVFAGGTFDIAQDKLYYSQLCPYEIRLYSLGGTQLSAVFRTNDFVFLPDVEIHKDGSMAFGTYGGSVSLVALNRGGFLNIAISPKDGNGQRTVIDMFESGGKLTAIGELAYACPIKCVDSLDRVYAVDLSSEPRVVRCTVQLR